MKPILPLLLSFVLAFAGKAQQQPLAFSFSEAEMQGISISRLDSLYQSALHTDTSLAVFKTEKEQEAMVAAYYQLLKDFGKYLATHDFRFEKPARTFNRIYFNEKGAVDYFLFNFSTGNVPPGDLLSEERKAEFTRLLSRFILNYSIPLAPGVKFSQCSPATFAAH